MEALESSSAHHFGINPDPRCTGQIRTCLFEELYQSCLRYVFPGREGWQGVVGGEVGLRVSSLSNWPEYKSFSWIIDKRNEFWSWNALILLEEMLASFPWNCEPTHPHPLIRVLPHAKYIFWCRRFEKKQNKFKESLMSM